MRKSKTVNSYKGYVSTLKFYVDGFQQPHIYLEIPEKEKNIKESATFYLKKINKKIIWIRLPNFDPRNQAQNTLVRIIKEIQNYRNSSYIIFDIRGNPGGYSDYYRKLLRNLYGDDYLRSLGKKFLWNQRWHEIWRASKANIKALKQQNPQMAVKLEKAHHAGKRLYHKYWYILNQKGNINKHNPVTAKIVILTNRESYSSSWLFTRIVLQLPNTTQMGQPTGILSYYSEPRSINLHHGIALYFPMGANLTPSDHFGKRFIPNYIFQGNIKDDKNVIAWVLKTLEQKPFR